MSIYDLARAAMPTLNWYEANPDPLHESALFMCHEWEKAGLGEAPYRCVGVEETPDEAVPTRTEWKLGTCQDCGMGLRWNFLILSSDRKKFVVGCDCALKVDGGKEIIGEVKRTHERTQRAAKKAAETRARHNAERARNGGLTNDELRRKQFDEERSAFVADHAELFDAVRASQNEFAIGLVEDCIRYVRISDAQKDVLHCIINKPDSQYFGEVGKRVKSHRLTVTKWIMIYRGSNIGRDQSKFLCLAEDDNGNQFAYFGTSSTCLPNEGESADVAFTVKEHKLYNDVKQTVIQRPKIL